MSDLASNYRLASRPFIESGRHILVIAQPKSGSTALCHILSEITGWPVGKYADRATYDFSFSRHQAASIADRDAVIHLHSMPRPALTPWMEQRQITPVVLFRRDIAAAVVSMYHHVKRRGGAYAQVLDSLPFERGVEHVAFQWAHWFIAFRHMWRARIMAMGRGLLIDTADFLERPGETAREALRVNGIIVDIETCERAAEAVLKDKGRSNFFDSAGDVPSGLREQIERLDREWIMAARHSRRDAPLPLDIDAAAAH